MIDLNKMYRNHDPYKYKKSSGKRQDVYRDNEFIGQIDKINNGLWAHDSMDTKLSRTTGWTSKFGAASDLERKRRKR